MRIGTSAKSCNGCPRTSLIAEGLVGASKKEKERSEKYQYRGQLRRVSHTFGHRHHLLQRGKRPFIECAARLPKFPGALQQTNQRYNKQKL